MFGEPFNNLMLITSPLLAADGSKPGALDKLRYPLLASPKVDGIRCITTPEGSVYSGRKLKTLPNGYACSKLSMLGSSFDGELICVKEGTPASNRMLPTSWKTFNDTQSDLMTQAGMPDFMYLIFDCHMNPMAGYSERLKQVSLTVDVKSWYNPLPHRMVHTLDELMQYEEECLALGYEGICLRSPAGRYKSGRSTLREQILIKLKRFVDDEATIIGMTELMHNENEATVDATGHMERSRHASGKRASGLMGALNVTHPIFGEFEVGCGFTTGDRLDFWQYPHAFIGKQITFKYQPFGMKDKPRCPVYKSLRHPNT